MDNSKLILGETANIHGKVAWNSPSNLAIVKYWGKYGKQLARNPSISLTLTNAMTKTVCTYQPRTEYDGDVEIRFKFEGKEHKKFSQRIQEYFQDIKPHVPFIGQLSFHIESENTFPHSSGIASSASSISALALCLCSIEHKLFKTLKEDDKFEQKASFLARLGSGSACRSIFDSWCLWGKTGEIEASSDEYGIDIKSQVHEIFHSFHDDIFILSDQEKAVSSSEGHRLMESNPYADKRYSEAKRQTYNLLHCLRTGDLETFGRIAEHEAMSLHALMMVSNPSYVLLEPGTVEMIKLIRKFRKQSDLPLYFSLDAGPNIHLLYPDYIKDDLSELIENELKPLCVNGLVIRDKVGPGPEQII